MTNHYTLDQLDAFPWIVSTDTLRNEDLLVRYWQAAEQCHAIKYSGHPFAAEHPTLAQRLERLAGEDSKESDWDEEQAAQCVDDLAEILQDYAPAGFGFGASIGDGACLGFWLDDAWVEALEHCGWAADSDPAALADVIRELEADGIDCDNFQDAYCGETEGYEEEVAGRNYAEQLAEELSPSFELDRTGSIPWPFRHIDWDDAWRELQTGDGYRVHRISGETWAVFRSV